MKLNILVLTKHFSNKYNSRLHIGFLLGLQKFGHKVKIIYQFDKSKLTAKELVDLHKPDILLCYFSTGIAAQQIRVLNCCKVLIEVDFYRAQKSLGLKWFKDCNFDLIVFRVALDLDRYRREIGIPTVWLPFSANHKEFYPDLLMKKEPVVSFAGHVGEWHYQRKLAIEKLKKAKIYKEYQFEYKIGLKYPDNLRRSLLWLTSTEREAFDSTVLEQRKTPRGKLFEAMASGAVVLTPSFLGEKSLFGEKECYLKYKDDCSDIVEQAKKAISNTEHIKVVRDNALAIFYQFHTHEKRLGELNHYLLDIFHGRKVTTFWHPE